ncbi:MAG: hypothetical protein WC882_03995 [Candidatus Gracilibacteria bacterium]
MRKPGVGTKSNILASSTDYGIVNHFTSGPACGINAVNVFGIGDGNGMSGFFAIKSIKAIFEIFGMIQMIAGAIFTI